MAQTGWGHTMFIHRSLLALPAGGKQSKAWPAPLPLGPVHQSTGMYKGLWSGHIPDGSCRAGQHCREQWRAYVLEKRRWWEKAGGRLGQDASGPQWHPKWLLCWSGPYQKIVKALSSAHHHFKGRWKRAQPSSWESRKTSKQCFRLRSGLRTHKKWSIFHLGPVVSVPACLV